MPGAVAAHFRLGCISTKRMMSDSHMLYTIRVPGPRRALTETPVSSSEIRGVMQTSEYQEIYTEIANFFSDVLSIGVPSPTTDLFKTGILDSQNFIELLLHLERKYDALVRLDDVDMERFRCIEKIVNLLCERVNGAKHLDN
jgi:acyl carrier protein